MRKAAKQILYCAVALILFCAVCRLTVFRTYTAHIPIYMAGNGIQEGGPRPTLKMDRPEVARLGEEKWHDNVVSVPIHPDQEGKTDVLILDQNGEEIGLHLLRVGRFGTVYDPQTGGFTGDTAVLIAVTLFWFLVSAIMLWHYFQAKGPAYYAYSTIYYAGFSLFSLATGVLLLSLTISHVTCPAEFSMFFAYNAINGASKQFMMLTMPAMVIFALAMAVSNIALLLHERPRPQNVLALGVSVLLIAGEAAGMYLFSRDFMGSEWEGRIRDTLENVFATGFVYFECMLIGSVICGITAARHQPDPDKIGRAHV